MSRGVHFLFKKLIRPNSRNEDLDRREFILNILLLGVIVLFGLGFIISIYFFVFDAQYNGLSLSIFGAIFLFFIGMLFLSRFGKSVLVSHIFVWFFFICTSLAIIKWGVGLPAALLFLVLIIVISGILINTYYAFFFTLLACLDVVIIGILQIINLIRVNIDWQIQKIGLEDIFFFLVIFGIIFVVSWLSNREIESSLKRARRSELELKKEKDNLKIRVVERTKKLRELQMHQVGQLYRFAEFGRLSSGLFHDLINRLTPVSLNMEQAQMSNRTIKETKNYLSEAIVSAKKMEDFIIAAKKQMTQIESNTNFSLVKEIEEVIEILNYKARKLGVEIKFFFDRDIEIFGDSVKFSQIAVNLISNAIDSYDDETKESNRQVLVSLKNEEGFGVLSVKDFGHGITKENIKFVFEPFFTTKKLGKGTGVGLAITKEIVEKAFNGSIEIKSQEKIGSEFIVKISKKHE